MEVIDSVSPHLERERQYRRYQAATAWRLLVLWAWAAEWCFLSAVLDPRWVLLQAAALSGQAVAIGATLDAAIKASLTWRRSS